jgi:succinate dehydrogenase/fumarate reductase flavoprotein subunit
MAKGARVESIDVIKHFRSALVKFQESANAALTDAESEMHQAHTWLDTEQRQHWQREIRKCQELVMRCKEAVRMKKLFKDSTGSKQSAIDEEKALKVAERKLQEAEQKSANVKRHLLKLPKEVQTYKGLTQRFATSVQQDIPLALARLGEMVAQLDAYVNYAVTEAGGGEPTPMSGVSGATSANEASMARAEVPEEPTEKPKESTESPPEAQAE